MKVLFGNQGAREISQPDVRNKRRSIADLHMSAFAALAQRIEITA